MVLSLGECAESVGHRAAGEPGLGREGQEFGGGLPCRERGERGDDIPFVAAPRLRVCDVVTHHRAGPGP